MPRVRARTPHPRRFASGLPRSVETRVEWRREDCIMPRMIAAVLLLTFTMEQAVAGPPEKASGTMVFDTVGDGLRKYEQSNDPYRRAALLRRLAPTRDPRVAVALGEGLADRAFPVSAAACDCIVD